MLPPVLDLNDIKPAPKPVKQSQDRCGQPFVSTLAGRWISLRRRFEPGGPRTYSQAPQPPTKGSGPRGLRFGSLLASSTLSARNQRNPLWLSDAARARPNLKRTNDDDPLVLLKGPIGDIRN